MGFPLFPSYFDGMYKFNSNSFANLTTFLSATPPSDSSGTS